MFVRAGACRSGLAVQERLRNQWRRSLTSAARSLTKVGRHQQALADLDLDLDLDPNRITLLLRILHRHVEAPGRPPGE